ncbi:bifunctional DedA family/phosphatase PAP2 family protein [Pseudomonas sp. RL_15y_Pfl2_60]|uniref:bifunctional DedA family/phosphatase PAP2 family protein n=1 Tax=Pseudomonas sp. RL_15y_Pfl2_60 TaxID=3088709 RepID=UPI0030DD3A12
MSQWIEPLTGWLSSNPQWLAAAVFLIALTECLAIVGLIVPGTFLLFAVAAMAGSGALSLGETLLLAYCGGLLGDALSYALGRFFHEDIRRLPGLRQRAHWLAYAENYFQRYGIASLLVGRFIGPLRPMLPMVAGMLNMPLPRFIVVSLLAAAGWSVAYLLPGWATGAALRLPLPPGFWTEAAIVAAGVGLFLLVAAQSNLRDQHHAGLITAGTGLVALIAMMIGWPHLDELDKGLMALIQEQRSSHADMLAQSITHLGDFTTQLAAGILLCLLLIAAKQWRSALFSAMTLLGTAVSNNVLKLMFARQRPDVLVEPLSSFSFPSGHSSAAFAFFLVLGVLAGRGQPARLRLTWLIVSCLPALMIACSRVYLGVHWPTDIIGGALLASTLCAASLALSQIKHPLAPLSMKAWWLIVPACTALLAGISIWQLSINALQYRY